MKAFLSIESKPTGVPYSRLSDDSESHGYVDLKKNRDLIDQLPECQRDKTLHDCVWHLNGPDSPLATIGCECAMNIGRDVPTDDGIEPVVYAKKGYIGIIFEDTSFGADPRDWFVVFKNASAKLEGQPAKNVDLQFVLAPCALYERGVGVWLLDIWLTTTWNSEEISEKMWDGWMKCAVSLVDESARAYVDANTLAGADQTLSDQGSS